MVAFLAVLWLSGLASPAKGLSREAMRTRSKPAQEALKGQEIPDTKLTEYSCCIDIVESA